MLKQFPFAQRVLTHLNLSHLISSVLFSLWLGEMNARNVCPTLLEMLLVYPRRTHLPSVARAIRSNSKHKKISKTRCIYIFNKARTD